MLERIRKFALIRKFKKIVKHVLKYVYSGQYDLTFLIKGIIENNNITDLLFAYIAIYVATERAIPIDTNDINYALEEYYSAKNKLSDPELAKLVLELHEKKAKYNLLQISAYFEIGKTAYESNEYSMEGMRYRAEKAKNGPLSIEEHKKFENLANQIGEVAHKRDEYLRKNK